MQTIRQITCVTPGKLQYEEVPFTEWDRTQVLIRIKRIGICGTDLHAFEGTQPFFTYPRILGHELGGEVVSAPSSSGFHAGDMVSVIPYLFCGECIACRTGKTNCCAHLQVCGVHTDGGMRELFAVPATVLLKMPGLTLDELALLEPLSVSAHAVKRANIVPGEFVAVMGAGPIGIGVMEWARIHGAKVIAIDTNPLRLQFCRNVLHTHAVVDAGNGDLQQSLSGITRGDMPTVIFDATGNRNAINNGFSLMAHGGRYVLVGLQKNEIVFSHPEFHRREGTLLSSRNATREDFERVGEAILTKQINPYHFITHRIAFNDLPGMMGTLLNTASGVIKAIVEL